MGFSDFHNSTPNPAQRYYRWSGGEKKVTLENGETVKKLKGELVFWDGENMQVQPLPFRFCVLRQTSSVAGFAPRGMGEDVRYYSNEITSFDEPIKVMRSSDSGTEVVAEGIYQNIKKSLPEGCKYQTNLYVYNPETKRIERLNLKGSALSAYITFGQKNKGIYEHVVVMEEGEQKTTGAVDYIEPKFTFGDKYTDEDMKVLLEQDKILIEYLRGKREANLANNGDDAGITDITGSDTPVDQTPAHYDGEQNQETGGFSMEDMPF